MNRFLCGYKFSTALGNFQGAWLLDNMLLSLCNHSILSNWLRPYGLQCARLPCPSLSPGVCSNSCSSSWWCHPTISSSVIPFSSCLQSFPASGSFPVSQFFTSGGQSIGTSASTLYFVTSSNCPYYCVCSWKSYLFLRMINMEKFTWEILMW